VTIQALKQPDAAILALLAGGASTARIVDIGAHRHSWTAADVRRVAQTRETPQGTPRATRRQPTLPAAPPANTDVLTVAEVAAVLRVSPMTVYRLLHSGELPSIRVRRSFRIRRTDVDEYLRKGGVAS
jgi:excisionase family DNA binding protein